MGLFGGSSTPTIDTGQLNTINQNNANKQRQIIQNKFNSLQPLNAQYKTDQTNFANTIQPQVQANVDQFGRSLTGVNEADAAQREQANNQFRTQQFQGVPDVQRAIRNSLGGNRLLNSGAAVSTLAQPTVQAAEASSNFAGQNEQAHLAGVTGRANELATSGFNANQDALAKKLGINEDTINQLLAMGRGDLVDQFNSMAGVQSQEGANELAINELGQNSNIAKASADASKRGAILSSLGSLAGAGIGSFAANPLLGAAIGSQVGGTAGSIFGGTTPQPLDPTLMFALMQKRKGVANALGNNTTPTTAG